jgi:hypothetical protein
LACDPQRIIDERNILSHVRVSQRHRRTSTNADAQGKGFCRNVVAGDVDGGDGSAR